MPNYYFDSSALVKYYHHEPVSPEVIRLTQTPDTRHYISHLTFIELHSAFGGKVRAVRRGRQQEVFGWRFEAHHPFFERITWQHADSSLPRVVGHILTLRAAGSARAFPHVRIYP